MDSAASRWVWGIRSVGTSRHAPLTLTVPEVPWGLRGGARWGTQGALCRGGGKRVCQAGGGAGRGGRGAAGSQRRLVRPRPPSASGRRRLASLPSPLPRAPGRPGAEGLAGRRGLVARLEAASCPCVTRFPHLPTRPTVPSALHWVPPPPPPIFISWDLVSPFVCAISAPRVPQDLCPSPRPPPPAPAAWMGVQVPRRYL